MAMANRYRYDEYVYEDDNPSVVLDCCGFPSSDPAPRIALGKGPASSRRLKSVSSRAKAAGSVKSKSKERQMSNSDDEENEIVAYSTNAAANAYNYNHHDGTGRRSRSCSKCKTIMIIAVIMGITHIGFFYLGAFLGSSDEIQIGGQTVSERLGLAPGSDVSLDDKNKTDADESETDVDGGNGTMSEIPLDNEGEGEDEEEVEEEEIECDEYVFQDGGEVMLSYATVDNLGDDSLEPVRRRRLLRQKYQTYADQLRAIGKGVEEEEEEKVWDAAKLISQKPIMGRNIEDNRKKRIMLNILDEGDPLKDGGGGISNEPRRRRAHTFMHTHEHMHDHAHTEQTIYVNGIKCKNGPVLSKTSKGDSKAAKMGSKMGPGKASKKGSDKAIEEDAIESVTGSGKASKKGEGKGKGKGTKMGSGKASKKDSGNVIEEDAIESVNGSGKASKKGEGTGGSGKGSTGSGKASKKGSDKAIEEDAIESVTGSGKASKKGEGTGGSGGTSTGSGKASKKGEGSGGTSTGSGKASKKGEGTQPLISPIGDDMGISSMGYTTDTSFMAKATGGSGKASKKGEGTGSSGKGSTGSGKASKKGEGSGDTGSSESSSGKASKKNASEGTGGSGKASKKGSDVSSDGDVTQPLLYSIDDVMSISSMVYTTDTSFMGDSKSSKGAGSGSGSAKSSKGTGGKTAEKGSEKSSKGTGVKASKKGSDKAKKKKGNGKAKKKKGKGKAKKKKGSGKAAKKGSKISSKSHQGSKISSIGDAMSISSIDFSMSSSLASEPSPTATPVISSPTHRPTPLERPSVSIDVCTVGEDDCLCGECVQECDHGPVETTLCNKFCKYVNGTSPPRNLFIQPYDDYIGDISVEFESEGSSCTDTIGLTRLGVYVIRKPRDNPNCDSSNAMINPNLYIKRISSDDETVNIQTSCSSALYVGQVIEEKYKIVGYCNDDQTCGIMSLA